MRSMPARSRRTSEMVKRGHSSFWNWVIMLLVVTMRMRRKLPQLAIPLTHLIALAAASARARLPAPPSAANYAEVSQGDSQIAANDGATEHLFHEEHGYAGLLAYSGASRTAFRGRSNRLFEDAVNAKRSGQRSP